MNTVSSGAYRWMVFKEGDAWIGVALEFNIVVTGEDPRVVESELQEAVIGYLESAKKIKGFQSSQVNSILNQRTEQEYESKWTDASRPASSRGETGTPSPFSDIYKMGISNLANV